MEYIILSIGYVPNNSGGFSEFLFLVKIINFTKTSQLSSDLF